MNQAEPSRSQTPPTLPPPLPTQPAVAPPEPEYEGPALGALLKAPGRWVGQLASGEELVAVSVALLLWGLLFHAVFGLSIGVFGGWGTAAMAAVKTPLIALGALLLCLPSLYIFACVGGMPLRLGQAMGVAATVVAATGLLLLGLAPVTWLFAVSTQSLGFVVLLDLVVWAVAMVFALQFFGRIGGDERLKRTAGLKWWLLVYVLVTLQMVTTMRPLLALPDKGWCTPGKKPFIVHFFESFENESPAAAKSSGRSR